MSDILLMSTADWDNPFWTNKQHVASELAKNGNRVFYIDSLGLRRPSATGRDLRRVLKRLVKAVMPPRQVRRNLWVWSPAVVPGHGNPRVRSVNRALLRAGLGFWTAVLRLNPEWLWTYSPLTTEFLDISRYRLRIYHCVDEIKAQPGMPASLISVAEKKLVENCDIVFATSHKLAETRTAWNKNTFYQPNVADYEHFKQALDHDLPVPADLSALPSPRIGFVGAISEYKVDFELLAAVAKSFPDCSVVLIGSVGEGDPWSKSEALRGIPNLHLLGPRSYHLLPAYLKGFDVALLPNNLNEYTASMFPMKFFEYLAAGRQVVSVQLDALQDFGHVAFLSPDKPSFIENVRRVLKGGGRSASELLRVAQKFTYATRTREMLHIISRIENDRR